MAKETVKSILNTNKRILVMNTDVLLMLERRAALVYSKLVELDGNPKTNRENGGIRVTRPYIIKYLGISLSTLDRAIDDLELLGLVRTKKASNGENIYYLNKKKAKEVFITKEEELENLDELRLKQAENPWGYDGQLEEEKINEKKKIVSEIEEKANKTKDIVKNVKLNEVEEMLDIDELEGLGWIDNEQYEY